MSCLKCSVIRVRASQLSKAQLACRCDGLARVSSWSWASIFAENSACWVIFTILVVSSAGDGIRQLLHVCGVLGGPRATQPKFPRVSDPKARPWPWVPTM